METIVDVCANLLLVTFTLGMVGAVLWLFKELWHG